MPYDETIVEELTYGLDVPLQKLEYDDNDNWIVIPFASQKRRDRIGDYLEVGGIDTGNHVLNPVCYLDHGKLGQTLPIGKCQDPEGNYTVWVDEDTAWAKIYLAVGMEGFPPPTPELVMQLYKGGFLKGGSIGYRPLEAEKLPPDPDNGYYKPALWLKRVELQEVTICGLPMNQDTVKSYLSSNLIDGKPLTPNVKSLLAQQYGLTAKNWSAGIDIGMKKDAMSATDQSRGGALVAPPGTEDQTNKFLKALKNFIKFFEDNESEDEDEKPAGKPEEETAKGKTMRKENKAEDDSDVPVDTEPEAKSEDKPDLAVTLEACKEHLEDAANHKDTPDDLREEHAKCAKAIGDMLEDSKSDEDEEDTKEDGHEDDAPDEECEDLDLAKSVKEHLEESAEHEGMPKMMAAAHKYHANELEKCMGKSEDEEEEKEMSEEDGAKVLSCLDRIGKRLGDSETILYRVFGS